VLWIDVAAAVKVRLRLLLLLLMLMLLCWGDWSGGDALLADASGAKVAGSTLWGFGFSGWERGGAVEGAAVVV